MIAPRLAAAAVLALSLSACGGGGDDEARTAFVERATAVCSEAKGEFDELPQPKAAADFAPFVRGTVEIAERAQGELEALTPPEEDREELRTRVLDPFGDVIEEGKAYLTQVEAAGDDQTKLLPLLSQRPTTEAIDLEYLKSYGLDACADAISTVG